MKATEGWLDDIKVGDEVYWVQRRREPQVMVVVRLTKARVFVRPAGQNTPIEYDFHRGDRGGMGGYKLEGRSVGGWSGLLYPITPERAREYNADIWRHVPLSQYYAAHEAHEAQDAQEAPQRDGEAA